MGKTKQIANIYKKDLRIRLTVAEQILCNFLDKYKFNYAFQQIVMKKKRKGFYIVDFCINMNPRVLIELDGSSHNGRKGYDRERTEYILKTKKFRDYTLIRFNNAAVLKGMAQKVIAAMYPKQFKSKN